MTHKRAKRWGRRAKPDGSCVPKLKRVRWKNRLQYARVGEHLMHIASAILLTAVGVWWMYFELGRRGLLFVFGISFSVNLWLDYIWVIFTILVCYGLITNWYSFYIIIKVRQLKKSVVANRCQLCPRCGYDLSLRVEETEPCPECGQRISRRECVRLWARYCGR